MRRAKCHIEKMRREKGSPRKWNGKREAGSKRAQIGCQALSDGTQQAAHKKGKKSARNFRKRHPPYGDRIRFLFEGRLPVWGGYPLLLNLRHIFDIALTFPTQKPTQNSSFQWILFRWCTTSLPKTDTTKPDLCRFSTSCVDSVSTLCRYLSTTLIDYQLLILKSVNS